MKFYRETGFNYNPPKDVGGTVNLIHSLSGYISTEQFLMQQKLKMFACSGFHKSRIYKILRIWETTKWQKNLSLLLTLERKC